MRTYVIDGKVYDVYEEDYLIKYLVELFYSDGIFLDDEIDKATDLAHDIISQDYVKLCEFKGSAYYLPLEMRDLNFDKISNIIIEELKMDRFK